MIFFSLRFVPLSELSRPNIAHLSIRYFDEIPNVMRRRWSGFFLFESSRSKMLIDRIENATLTKKLCRSQRDQRLTRDEISKCEKWKIVLEIYRRRRNLPVNAFVIVDRRIDRQLARSMCSTCFALKHFFFVLSRVLCSLFQCGRRCHFIPLHSLCTWAIHSFAIATTATTTEVWFT